ncbi:MAG: thiamine-phosphate kinase [Acidobacteria bacterium]|nr:MAG: thiamine-phosphate kinase [Acidobacteriota bacterium]
MRYNAGQKSFKTESEGARLRTDLAMRVRETELVEKIHRVLGRRHETSREVRLGMGDDAALFRAREGQEIILTCDWFLEGTHFLRDKHRPLSVGWKCLARAVSDIAAMGGVPRCFLLSLALPVSHTGRWLDEFLTGLRRASRKFRCPLAGGDTTRRNEVLISVTVAGDAPADSAMLRSGARPGELVYVSGRLGEADLGLQLLKRSKTAAKSANPLIRKHLYPEPRLALGQWLAQKRLATAMMDISDGLSSDLPRLCAAGGVGAWLESARIPQAGDGDIARKYGLDPLELALHGGDDYELLFTVPPHKAKVLPKSFRGVMLTPVGRITKGPNVVVGEENGRERPLVAGGWDPFQR